MALHFRAAGKSCLLRGGPAYLQRMTRSLLLSLAVLTSACGLTSPGGGTGTLYVSARLSGDGSTSGSRARVTVRQGSSGGDVVTDAEVAIRGGALNRTLVPFDADRGEYRLDAFTWVEGFRLEVVRGKDQLDGSIEAPGATLITEPISGSVFRRGDNRPLVIRWKDERGTGAEKTRLRLEKAKLERDFPMGVWMETVALDSLVVGTEKVDVTRTNDVDLAGGAAGSTLSATTDHELEFKIE